MTLPSYSVLMSVYAKEQPEYLAEALTCMATQTESPDQIVLVEDGPLTQELDQVVAAFEAAHPQLLTVKKLAENQGLGHALAKGMSVCRNEIVMRMDSDDWARPDRAELQLSAMERDGLDMVGSQIVEFSESPDKPVAESDLPENDVEIQAYSKKRNPFRHPAMMFKKSKVLAAGNYSSDFMFFEDWDLFNRMLARGCKARKLHEQLVAMRVSSDFYGRRGGLAYLPYLWKFKVAQLKSGYFSFSQFLVTTIPHVVVCLVPNGLRSLIYTHLLRKDASR